MNDLIATIEQMQAEAREGMKRASRDSDPYLYQYLVGKFHAFGKVAGMLKKQKEQKEPLPIPDKFSGLKSLMLQYLQSAANRKDDSEIESDTDLWGRKILDYVWKYSDEQKEPQYTKRNTLFDECVKNCDPEVMKKVSDEIDKMLQKEQKPVQSDVEREYIRTIKGIIADFIRDKKPGDVAYYQQIVDWLDGRHIEQKPAEWSEEDEDMLNSCISSIEEAKENRYAYKETDGDTSYDHEIAWLKSLRNRVGKEFLQPHWKPSEEQMKALLKVVDKARELHYSSNSGYDEYDVLRSLYKQLEQIG